MDTETELNAVLQACENFTSQFDSLILATVNPQGEAEASYAPYLAQQQRYYIYISTLASHTHNLLTKPKCQILFLENEADTKNLFARQRFSLNCEVSELARDTSDFTNCLDQFEEKFGKMFSLLRGLKDFRLFELSPINGKYVAGFGKTYELTGANLSQIQAISADVLKNRK